MSLNQKDKPREMCTAYSDDVTVRIRDGWLCPCGQRTLSPHDFRLDNDDVVTAICSHCHIDLIAIELVS